MKKKIKASRNIANKKIYPSNIAKDYLKSKKQLMNFDSGYIDEKFINEPLYDNETFGHQSDTRKSREKSNEIKKNHKRFENMNKQKILKVLNVIGYLGIIIGCMYQCFSFMSIYFLYPTIVELNVENEAVLTFPAVTVCNSNPVKYKIWCDEATKNGRDLCRRKPNETLETYNTRIRAEYDVLGKKRRIDLGYTLTEFIILAEYEDEPVVESFQRYYDYEFTNCFTFNGAWGKNKDPKTAIVFNPVTGKSSEFVLCVNMDKDNYSNISGITVPRTRMTIHANEIIPNPSYDATSLESGIFYSYGIQKVTTLLLKSPYQTNCRNYEEEREFRTGARMSQKNCLLECYKNENEKMCSCTYRRLAIMYDAKPCSKRIQFQCLDHVEDYVFRTCNPRCPMACKKIEFHNVATDTEPLRQDSDLYKKGNISRFFPTQEQMNLNMACMSIHYGSTETRTMSHRPKYAFIELFSLLGGYSGLWLGFSLLNAYGIVLKKLLERFWKRKNQRKENTKVFRKRHRYY